MDSAQPTPVQPAVIPLNSDEILADSTGEESALLDLRDTPGLPMRIKRAAGRDVPAVPDGDGLRAEYIHEHDHVDEDAGQYVCAGSADYDDHDVGGLCRYPDAAAD